MPKAAKAKKATPKPKVANGTGGEGDVEAGAAEPGSPKAGAAEAPASHDVHLSRVEAAREAKAALDGLKMPFKPKLGGKGLKLEITRWTPQILCSISALHPGTTQPLAVPMVLGLHCSSSVVSPHANSEELSSVSTQHPSLHPLD